MELKDGKKKVDREFSFRYYWHGLPEILYYQIPTRIGLYLMMLLSRGLLGTLLTLTGIYSVTSGELPSLILSWKGWLVLILLFIAYTIYKSFDVIILILLSRNILYDQDKSFKEIIQIALRVVRKFISIRGCLLIAYIAIIIPLNTAMFGMRLTKFGVPDFIYSVVRTNQIYLLIYIVIVLALDYIGLIHIFTFHGVLFQEYSLKESMRVSREMVCKNWKKIITSYVKFFDLFVVILAGSAAIIAGISYLLSRLLVQYTTVYHFIIIMVVILGSIFLALFSMIFIQAQTMCITRVYDEINHIAYKESNFQPPVILQRSFRYVVVLSLVVATLLGWVGSLGFDVLFPKEYETEVIAHRGGGEAAVENTVESIRWAIENGANASEIDVQRTKDGHYVVFHDNNLKRLCGDDHTIQELTLEEIKKLRITAADGHKVRIATLEEILNTAKDEIQLYIELKGRSADIQMATDVYRMLEERNMVDQVRILSLDARLITEVENQFPDVETEYLCFIVFGKLAMMNVDVIAFEEEAATTNQIDLMHTAGKKIDVWTCNSLGSIMRFMNSDVDGIITDDIDLAINIKNGKKDYPDFMRLLRIFFPQF